MTSDCNRTQTNPNPFGLNDRNSMIPSGTPGRIRTCDLWFRRPTLYPAELRARASILNDLGSSVILVYCILAAY